MNRMRLLSGLGFVAALIAIQLCEGCKSAPAGAQTTISSPPRSLPRNTAAEDEALRSGDACASRLQDIGGLFLLYNLQHHRMPDSLDQLKALPGASDVGDFVCPESKKPYVYNRDGFRSPSGAGIIVVYDPEPSHSNMRLCLEIIQLQTPAQTKVIPLPESFFRGK
jgi:hypothetical protein